MPIGIPHGPGGGGATARFARTDLEPVSDRMRNVGWVTAAGVIPRVVEAELESA